MRAAQDARRECRAYGPHQAAWHSAPYLCRFSASSRAWSWWVGPQVVGGACGWLVVRVVRARTPSLISVRDPGWLRVGDMMGDGLIRSVDAVRPLGLCRPSIRGWRQELAGSRPRCIGVSEGSARRPKVMRVPAPPRRAHAGCGSALEQLARDRHAGAVAAEPRGRLEVVLMVGGAGAAGVLGGLEQRPSQRRRALRERRPGARRASDWWTVMSMPA